MSPTCEHHPPTHACASCLDPAVRSEQSQKAARPAQEDRSKKLDERADAVEKAASSAVLEKASPVSQCTISPLGSRCSWL